MADTDTNDTSDASQPPTVEATLRLGHGIHESERAHVVGVLERLDARMRSFRAGSVDMQLSVKERDTPSQRMTLEAWIAGFADLVATSEREDFDGALAEVRDDLVRRITDHKNRSEPRNNRHMRQSLSDLPSED